MRFAEVQQTANAAAARARSMAAAVGNLPVAPVESDAQEVYSQYSDLNSDLQLSKLHGDIERVAEEVDSKMSSIRHNYYSHY